MALYKTCVSKKSFDFLVRRLESLRLDAENHEAECIEKHGALSHSASWYGGRASAFRGFLKIIQEQDNG